MGEINNLLKKQSKAVQSHPIQTAILLIVAYFLMDGILLNVTEDAGMEIAVVCLILSFLLFFLCYVMGYLLGGNTREGGDIPAFIKSPKKYVILLFCVLILLTIAITIGYDDIITKWIPGVDAAYYQSQVILMVLIAPVMEELSYRYFLYDCWAKQKFGTVKGILITAVLFIIGHPVTNLDAAVLYLVPTLLFYLIYGSYGLYGSIAAHIIFNFIAI